MKYITLSRRQVEDQEYFFRRFQDNCNYLLISSWSGTKPPVLNLTTNCVGSLQLNFEDFSSKSDAGYIKVHFEKTGILLPIFQIKHAEQILELVNKYILEVDTVITQCEAGASRSKGIVNALSMILDGKLYSNNNRVGNEYVYDKILKQYNDDFNSYPNIKKYIELEHKEFIKYRR